MITDRRAAEQLNAFVAFLSGRAAEFLYETSSQCGRRSHAWPVVRRAHFRSKASTRRLLAGGDAGCPAMGLATIEQLALCSAKQIPGAQ
jgi:hypothetical protein